MASLTPLLALLIAFFGLSIMLRPIIGRGRGRGGGLIGGGGRRGGQSTLQLLLFSVLLPAAWWAIALAGRLYQSAYVVFTEFLTGVPDWVSYRTSAFKFLGATLAFVAYNVILVLAVCLLLVVNGVPAVSSAALFAQVLGCVSLGVMARACMRRAP